MDKTHVLVILQGGVIQDVLSTGGPVDVDILDWDEIYSENWDTIFDLIKAAEFWPKKWRDETLPQLLEAYDNAPDWVGDLPEWVVRQREATIKNTLKELEAM